jgi:hypothetical protein
LKVCFDSPHDFLVDCALAGIEHVDTLLQSCRWMEHAQMSLLLISRTCWPPIHVARQLCLRKEGVAGVLVRADQREPG